MNKKDIDLFDKAIHNVKKTIIDIEKERTQYNKKLNNVMKMIEKIRNVHNVKMQELIAESKEVLSEVYELFEDLYEEEKK